MLISTGSYIKRQ